MEFVRVGYFIPLNGPLNGHPPSISSVCLCILPTEYTSSPVVRPGPNKFGTHMQIHLPVADRVIKATRCEWLLATTNVDFARTLHNFRLTDSIFESVRRLLSWSGQQHTNVLASLRPAYITQLLGVSRQTIRHLGVSRLARH